MMKAIIIDDEPMVREDLRHLLDAHQDIRIIGEAGTVREAEKLLARLRPDVIFLDIQLIGGTGFDLVLLIFPATRIIFFTSYDEYAIRTFEVNALDYLLKPVSAERLADGHWTKSSPGSPSPGIISVEMIGFLFIQTGNSVLSQCGKFSPSHSSVAIIPLFT